METILAGYVANDSIYGSGTALGDGSDVNAGNIVFQVGANKGDTISLDVSSFQFSNMSERIANGKTASDLGLESIGTKTIGGITADDFTSINGGTKAANANVMVFNLSDAALAKNAIEGIDMMIADVDKQRSALGAMQNRLESSIRVQSNVATNTSDARARIRDTDFAEESANLSQQSIIQQAATSMLMQANARPQLGLSLLG